MGEILSIIAALVLLYFFLDIMYFIVVHWVWVAGILGSIIVFGMIFFPNSGPRSSSSSSVEGDYTVYDLGKEDAQVDRYHIRKD